MAHGYILECHIDDFHKDLMKELEDLKKQLNRLLRCSNEVKDGTIKNQYCKREYTASFAWELLKREANLK